MSKKGGGGGSVSGRGGGASSRISGGPSGGSNFDVGRTSHFKAVQTDAKYGMLMWQSKQQDKYIKEQKEKKEKESQRRKSDEDYQQQKRAASLRPGPLPARGGSGGRTSKNNNNNTGPTSTTISQSVSDPKVSYSENGERFLHISREEPHPDPAMMPTVLVTDVESHIPDLSGNFGAPNNDTHLASNFDASTYLGNVRTPGARHGTVYGNSNSRDQYHSNPNYGGANGNGRPEGMIGNYHESHLGEGNGNANTKVEGLLPRIGNVSSSSNHMPKISNSISCDNLSKTSLPPPTHQHDLSPSNYPFSPNLAFFGLSGFGSGTGAGAPRRSPSGRLITHLQGHPEIRYHQKDTRGFDQTLRYMMDKERIHQYKEDLDKQVMENTKQRRNGMGIPIKIMSSHESTQNLMGLGDVPHNNFPDYDMSAPGASRWNYGRKSSRNSGIELAPLIRKYKSLPKLNNLSSTDVTRQYAGSPRTEYCLSPEPEELAKSLSLQLAEKQKSHKIEQENERVEAERHFSTWDSFWGRPGHGAPIFYYRNSRLGASTPSLVTSRSDLFKSLHMTHQKKAKEK